ASLVKDRPRRLPATQHWRSNGTGAVGECPFTAGPSSNLTRLIRDRRDELLPAAAGRQSVSYHWVQSTSRQCFSAVGLLDVLLLKRRQPLPCGGPLEKTCARSEE